MEGLELARSFMKKALRDLRSAEVLFNEKIFEDSAYHAQQAAEKAMKALLILKGKLVFEHRIASLFRDEFLIIPPKGWEEKLRKAVIYAFNLESHWIKPRYPFENENGFWDPTEAYNEEITRELLEQARFVVETLRKFAKEELGVEL